MPRLRSFLGFVAFLAVVAWGANFFWFFGEAVQLGGANGPVVGGRYYLDDHGSIIPTTRELWEHLHLHETLTFVTFPICWGAGMYLILGFVLPVMRGLHRSPDVDSRIKAVRSASRPLATIRCHVNIAGADNPEWYRISVFPSGLVIRLNPLAEAAILKGEIRAISAQTATATHKAGLRIQHDGHDVESPIILYIDVSGPIAQTLRMMVESNSFSGTRLA